jgi:3-hydroxyacyl-CoA dehydrogenase
VTEPGAPVAVVGAGALGVGFLVLFAAAGHRVQVWDADGAAPGRAAGEVAHRLERLAAHGLLAEPPDAVSARIIFFDQLADAVRGVELVQECAAEDLEVKQALFGRLTALTAEHVILASSSSALIPSSYSAATGAAERILGAHPGNPPYLLPVIEIIPSPDTRAEIVRRATELYASAGLHPVHVRREVEGFVFNRLQGALLREAYCLVRDGVADVADIDAVVRDGLGPRWSVVGPFETVDLNTRGGIEAHAARMGPAYARMGAERGQHDPWTPELVAAVAAQRRADLPLADWSDRVRWRDEQLMQRRATRSNAQAPEDKENNDKRPEANLPP